MAGIIDVAREAGVSTATVSRALSGKDYVSPETKELVQEVANRLGYVPSSSAYTLVTGRTRNIGVVVPYVDRWFFSTALETIDRELVKAGYDVTLYNLSSGDAHRESVFTNSLPRKRFDAVLCIAVKMTDEEMAALNKVNKPIVSVGGLLEGAHCITINDSAAGQLATEHLLAMGHTQIAMIGGGSTDEKLFSVFDERREGYETALKLAAIKPRSAWYKQVNKYAISEGYSAAKQLLGDPHNSPTAIFASSDELAVGAMLAAKDLGLSVPDDVSIVGVDNHELADFFGITTVDQNVTGQAELSVKTLLKMLDNPTEDAEMVVDWPVELVVRSSTTRVRAKDQNSLMADSSFDIVSKVDKQEVANALNQAQKEIEQRYDFKGVGAEIDYSGEKILMKANSEERVKAVLDVFQSKLVKRNISLKSLDDGKPYPSGKEYRIEASIKEGIEQPEAKKIAALIREQGPKSVKANIQGDELRVSSKSRDDLQDVITLLKTADLEIDVQFVNYR